MIFLDSNIPMYVAGREHPNREPARRFFKRAPDGTVDACTSTEVLQEILYRYLSLGLTRKASEVYELFVQTCRVVLSVTLTHTDRARALLVSIDRISARDAVHAGVMLDHGIQQIATFDTDFDVIPGIRRVRLPWCHTSQCGRGTKSGRLGVLRRKS